MKNKKEKHLDTLDTVVGATTSFEGTIKTESSLRVDGTVKGEIHCSGDLTVGTDGTVEANVNGRNVIVAGKITGNIEASGTVHIEATGKVQGDAKMKAFIIDEGGTFEGKSNMNQSATTNNKEQKKAVDKKAN